MNDGNGTTKFPFDGYTPGADPEHTAWVQARAEKHRIEQRQRKAQLPRNAAGLREALERLGIEVRYNIRASRIEFCTQSGIWAPATDRCEASLQEEISTRFISMGKRPVPLLFGREIWLRCVNALVADREIDPFVEYLESLPPWDGTRRIDQWLATVFRADSSALLVRWVSRFVFLGPVVRAYRPGAKLDETPVLIGPEGIGKSTCLSMALPPDCPEYFGDGLHLASNPKERVEALQGRAIVELSEMAGSSRAEVESLNAFLTRTDDGNLRLAYRRNAEPMPRRCVFIGTANGPCLPTSAGGTRRFVAIEVGRGPNGVAGVRSYLDEWREGLWAEAAAAFRDGVEARLPEKLAPMQSTSNNDFRRRDELLEDVLDQWLSSQKRPFALADAAVGCKLIERERVTRLGMAEQRRLGTALRAAGWDRRRVRIDGFRVSRWCRVGSGGEE